MQRPCAESARHNSEDNARTQTRGQVHASQRKAHALTRRTDFVVVVVNTTFVLLGDIVSSRPSA